MVGYRMAHKIVTSWREDECLYLMLRTAHATQMASHHRCGHCRNGRPHISASTPVGALTNASAGQQHRGRRRRRSNMPNESAHAFIPITTLRPTSPSTRSRIGRSDAGSSCGCRIASSGYSMIMCGLQARSVARSAAAMRQSTSTCPRRTSAMPTALRPA
jgi:hypothetical protein